MFPGRCFGLAVGIGEFQTSHWVSTPPLDSYSWGADTWCGLGVVDTARPCSGNSRIIV